MRAILATLLILTAFPTNAQPQVVTDIAPVHSLVSAVMDGIGEPDLLLDATVDAHHITLRPSQARALADAQVVFWIGPALTPWLAKPVDTLPEGAHSVALSDVVGTTLIDVGGGKIDPHAWLDPDNAALWLPAIAEALGRIDPENAASYVANAKTAVAALQTLNAKMIAELAPQSDKRYLVTHDAYSYFASHFGLRLTEAISDSDAAAPTAARLAELRDSLTATPVTCAFREPQQSPAALNTLLAGTATPQATLDPLGTALTPGPALYPDLLRAMIDSITTCAD